MFIATSLLQFLKRRRRDMLLMQFKQISNEIAL